MNAPTYMDWAVWFGTLLLLGFFVPVVARLLSSQVRASTARQAIWRGAFLVLLVVSFGETFGAFRAIGVLWKSAEPAEGQWTITSPMPGEQEPAPFEEVSIARPDLPVFASKTQWKHTRSWIPGGIVLGGFVLGLFYWFVIRLGLAFYVGRRSITLDRAVNECLAETVERMGFHGRFCLKISSGTLGPFAFGTLYPTILVPAELLSEFSNEESALVLAHELGHLKNGDNVWQPLVDLVALAFWWHPAVWWARKELNIIGEYAADSQAVRADFKPESLAACLVKFGRRAWARHRLSVLFQNGTAFHSALGRRVERLLQGGSVGEVAASKRWALSSSTLVLMTVFYVLFSRLIFPDLSAVTPIGELMLNRDAALEPGPRVGQEAEVTKGELEVLESDQPSELKEEEVSFDPMLLDGVSAENEVLEDHSVDPAVEKVDGPSQKYLTRHYRVEPVRAVAAVCELLGEDPDAERSSFDRQMLFRRLFRQAGISVAMEPGNLPDKSEATIFYSDDRGMLLARGLETELQAMEDVIALLSASLPQVVVSLKLAEVSAAAATELFSGRTSRTDADIETSNQESHLILSEREYGTLINEFLGRDGVDVLSAPSMTTLSGRSGELSMLEKQTVVIPRDSVGSEAEPIASSVTASSDANGGDDPAIFTRSVDVGPTIRVLPRVHSNMKEMELDVEFKMREFLGYDDPGPSAAGIVVEGKKVFQTLPLPRFREREAKASVRLLDGGAVVMRGMEATSIRKIKGKIPLLGDIPLIGRMFRREKTEEEKTVVLVFVSAIVIDPAGNRVN